MFTKTNGHVKIIEHAVFLVAVNSRSCRENINYSINTSDDRVYEGNCSQSSANTVADPCTCSVSSPSRKECIYVVNCSRLYRNITFFSYQTGSPLSIFLTVRLKGNREAASLSYLRYFQSMYECRPETLWAPICRVVKNDFSTANIRCNERQDIAYHSCSCVRGVPYKSRTRHEDGPITPALFWQTIVGITATEPHSEKSHFFLFNTNFLLKSINIPSESMASKAIFKKELSEIMLEGVNICPVDSTEFTALASETGEKKRGRKGKKNKKDEKKRKKKKKGKKGRGA